MHRNCSLTMSSFVDNTITKKTVDYCYRNFTCRRRRFLNISRETKSGIEIIFGKYSINPIEQQQQQQWPSRCSYSSSPSFYSNETKITTSSSSSSSQHNNQSSLGDKNNNIDDTNGKIYGTIPQYGNGIAIGQYACIERVFTINDVTNFSKLSGDTNPLHTLWKLNNIPEIISNHTLLQWEDNNNNNNNNENDDENDDTNKSTITSQVLVHGMLVSSMFTCIFGTLIPGAVYMKQNIIFRKPVYVNTKVVATITINKIRTFPNNSTGSSNNNNQHQQLQHKEEHKHKSGLIVSCSTIVSSSSIHSIHNDTEIKETSPIIEYVKGDAIVWMTKGVELDK